MKTVSTKRRQHLGFSLGEMLAALVIGAMVMTSVLSIYGRANQASEAVARRIDTPALGTEVLQLIAQDLDRLTDNSNATIEIRNGFDGGFARAEMVLRRTFHDGNNAEQTFEEITWRAGYDHDSGIPGLVLYRSHSGLTPEDKLLDSRRAAGEENYPFVPICRGLTFFRIEVTNGERVSDAWSGSFLPPGIRISLSFSPPYKTVEGTLDVDESKKTSRIIAVNKTRTIRFTIPEKTDQSTANNERTSAQPQR